MDARLLARHQDAIGTWTYTVALRVPADAVRPVAGEEYGLVPTWRPWILHTPWMDKPGTLHAACCPSAGGPRGIGLRGLTTDQAHELLRTEPETRRCPWCEPRP